MLLPELGYYCLRLAHSADDTVLPVCIQLGSSVNDSANPFLSTGTRRFTVSPG